MSTVAVSEGARTRVALQSAGLKHTSSPPLIKPTNATQELRPSRGRFVTVGNRSASAAILYD